ncbi:MAG: hypothetical protein HZC50_06115 [Nitrospirae bacterium]|nr:hypothetical protein [Nitrospirota bacterium]
MSLRSCVAPWILCLAMLSLIRLTPTGRDLSGTELAKHTIACLSDSMVLFSAPSLYR